MLVEFAIEIDFEPTDAHDAHLRADARRLSDRASDIGVVRREKGERHVLAVRFRMRRQAQYKVVSDIAHAFNMGFGTVYGWRDLSISFPRE